MGIRCADHVTPLYPQKLALTSPTDGGRSIVIVRSRTKATDFFFYLTYSLIYQHQWPCGLMSGSAAARLLGLRVRILPGNEYLSLLSVVYCQVGISATSRSLIRSPTECGVYECEPRSTRSCRATNKTHKYYFWCGDAAGILEFATNKTSQCS